MNGYLKFVTKMQQLRGKERISCAT